MPTDRKRVLFLCRGNSARSIMAQALLTHLAADQFDVDSAGTQPQGIDPRTLSALTHAGVSTQGLHSKDIASVAAEAFDYVITLCDKAHQECSHWPHAGVVMAWDFPDPKESQDTQAFNRTLHAINERLKLFVLVHSKPMQQLASALTALTFYKALADETRLKMLLLIEQHDELCVCDLMTALNEAQPKISRHLAQLRKQGLLLDRRQGQWVHYRLNPDVPRWMLDVLHQTRLHSQAWLALANQPLHNTAPCQPQGASDHGII